MIQQSQGLSLGLETGYDTLGIHAGLDDFKSYLPPDWLLLLGQVHHPHAAFAQDAQQLVPANPTARRFGEEIERRRLPGILLGCRIFQTEMEKLIDPVGVSSEC
jgi:hypothetical protein